MSYTNFSAQIQIFLLFRIILNKDISNLLRLGTAFKKPTMFKNLLRLIVYLQENQLSYNIIRF